MKKILLLLLLVALFGATLGTPGLWEKDEARYAQSAREMRRGGDMLIPMLDGKPRLNKPPLLYWLIAGGQTLFGENELSARIPTALAGILASLLVFAFARRLGGFRAGVIASLVYATSALGLGMGRIAHPDGLISLFVTAAMTLFYFAYRRDFEKPWPVLLGWLAMGLGFLSKGPHGIILPLLLVLVFLSFRRDIGAFRRLRPVRGILLALAPFLLWGAAVWLREGNAVLDLFYNETIGRFFGGKSFHPEPAYFFLPVIFGGFLPWTLWMPTMLRRNEQPAGGLYLAVWAIGTVAFFSLSTNKATGYVLPAIPPLAIALGIAMAKPRTGAAAALSGILHLLTGAGLALVVVLRPEFLSRVDLLAEPTHVWITGGILLLTMVTVGLLQLCGRVRPAVPVALVGAIATTLTAVVFVVPQLSPQMSMREAGRAAASALEGGGRFVNLGTPRASLPWYSDHVVETDPKAQHLSPVWDGPGKLVVCSDRKRYRRLLRQLAKLRNGPGPDPVILWRDPGGRHLVYCNRE